MPGASGVKAGKAFVVIEAMDKTAFVFKRVGARMRKFSSGMNRLGASMVRRGVMAMLPIAASVKVFANFDDSMRKVEARSGGTAQEMAALRDQAKELGRTTSFTASQVGELQAKLAQKGYNRGQIKAMTADVMNLARAAGEGDEGDTVVAADLISGTLRAFKLEASDAGRVADVFTTAVNNSNFSLEGLMDGMAKAGPLAADYGMSVEETAATLASMTNLNISASEAGTAMQSFLARMSKSQFTDQFNSGLAAMGKQTIKFRDDAGNLRKPLDLLAEIGEVTKDLGTAERGDLMSVLFGVRQFGKAAGGARGAVDAMELLNKLQNESRGEAKRTAEVMDSGVGGSFRKLWSAVEGVAIAIGESLAPTIQDLTAFINDNLGAFTEWIEANRGIIVAVAAVIAGVILTGVALMGLSVVVYALGTAFSVLSTAIVITKGLLAILISPFGLVVAAIVAVIAVLYHFSTAFREVIDGVVGFVGEKFSAMGETLVKTWNGVMKALNAGDFEAAWAIVVDGLSLVWAEFVDFAKSAWAKFASFFVEAWNGAVLLFKQGLYSAQRELADWMLSTAAQGGIAGDAMSMVIGVDVEELKKEAERLERKGNAQAAKEKASAPALMQTAANFEDLFETGFANMADSVDKEALRKAIEQSIKDNDSIWSELHTTATDRGPFSKEEIEKAGLEMDRIADHELGKMSEKFGVSQEDLARLIAYRSEMEGVRRVAQDRSGLDTTFRDPMARMRAEMRADFNKKIDESNKKQADALTEWNKSVDEASEMRRKEIEEKRKALEARIDAVPEKEVEEPADDLAEAMGEAKDALAKLGDGLGGPGPVVSPQLQQGLEKGTMEAAKAFNKNLQNNNLMKKAVDLHEKEVELLGDAVELLDDPAWLEEVGFI